MWKLGLKVSHDITGPLKYVYDCKNGFIRTYAALQRRSYGSQALCMITCGLRIAPGFTVSAADSLAYGKSRDTRVHTSGSEVLSKLVPAAMLHVLPFHISQSLHSAHTGASIYAESANDNVCHPQSCTCC